MSREDRRQRRRAERRAKRTETSRQVMSEDIASDRERTPPAQFLREVRAELKKVAWPNRREVASYTLVVVITTAALTAFVFGLDWVVSKAVLTVFG